MFKLTQALTQGSGAGMWITLGMMALLFGFMYFFMIRPQKKQEKKDAEMRNNLAVGDEVTTIGGIIGKVVSIKDETFVLETTKDRTKIRFLRGAIRSVDVKIADVAAANAEAKAEENTASTEEKPEEK
jgi:preprotein translocase subunit YajC